MSARKAYLLGSPVAHSISPAIHNAAFDAARLSIHYGARDVPTGALAAAIEALRAPCVVGANVTVPHKQAVLTLVDELEPTARLIGAVNTIVNRAGRLWATNTDVSGFSRSLCEAGIDSRDQAVLLLGAGGSARAVAHAVLRDRARSLVIANRHEDRAGDLAAELRRWYPDKEIRAVALARLDRSQLTDVSLIVNTTTVGLTDDVSPLATTLLPKTGTLVDIIYNPPRTRLLREAEQAGLRTLNGVGMLVHQAAAAWELWAEQDAPLERMWMAARQALAPQ